LPPSTLPPPSRPPPPQDEIEDLDEQLNDSAQAALQGRKRAEGEGEGEGEAKGKGKGKRRRALDESDEEYLGESDDEDEFYDRTSAAAKVGFGG
jgi:hypothetical protein